MNFAPRRTAIALMAIDPVRRKSGSLLCFSVPLSGGFGLTRVKHRA
jgi:hypothetical protein